MRDPGPIGKGTPPSGRLRAELTACGSERNLRKALIAGLYRDRSNWSEAHAGHDLGDGNDDQEINDEGDDQKVDDGVEKLADVDFAWLDVVGRQRVGWHHRVQYRQVNDEAGKVRRAGQRGDERGDDVGGERGGNGSESRSDDDGDCEIDHVAAKNKIPKTFEQYTFLRRSNSMQRSDCILSRRSLIISQG